MNVTFYFDPSCPFSWITSRWLLVVSGRRDVRVKWRPFCLALKNDEAEPRDGEDKNAPAHRDSLRALRVLLALEKDNDVALIDGYNASGMVRHILGDSLDDRGIKFMLKEQLGLSEPVAASLARAADDTSYDAALRASIDEAISVVGRDIGVPTIVFERDDGTKLGYFGPVLNELPSPEESLAIWDGLYRLATVSSFYELKRNRPDGDPNVVSTARC